MSSNPLPDADLEARATRDQAAITEVSRDILRRLPPGTSASEFFGRLVRQAIDEVLSLRTRTWSISQLDRPEQTYIGTRIEVLVRDALDVGVGHRADTLIAGHDVDIKWSRKLKWMIGPENLGTVCLGIGSGKDESKLSVGLFVPYSEHLSGQNRDKKYGVTVKFLQRVDWIVRDAELPPNFFASLAEGDREDILSQPSAQARIRRLAELCPYVPIPRAALQLASFNKDDFMRRIREDASRHEYPLGRMVCLSWKYRKAELERLGINLKRDEFVFVPRSHLPK